METYERQGLVLALDSLLAHVNPDTGCKELISSDWADVEQKVADFLENSRDFLAKSELVKILAGLDAASDSRVSEDEKAGLKAIEEAKKILKDKFGICKCKMCGKHYVKGTGSLEDYCSEKCREFDEEWKKLERGDYGDVGPDRDL